jgi:tRNA threonylcarbamoyladenosine biosynthesis protein TsaE
VSEPFTIESASVAETLEIGAMLAGCLHPNDVVALVGPLGAGKTHLVKGIARGLGVLDDRLVNSPTFVLVNEYDGRLHLYHLDAYRLPTALEFEALGFAEMCASHGAVVVEWADRVTRAFGPDTLWIELGVTGETSRRLTFRTDSADFARRLHNSGLDRRPQTGKMKPV